MPAPTSRNAAACSNSSALIPRNFSASAVVKPPMPPPTMSTFGFLPGIIPEAQTGRVRTPSPPPEQFVERRLHLLLLLGGRDRHDHLLLLQPVDHARRVGLDVGAGRQAALLGEERLA